MLNLENFFSNCNVDYVKDVDQWHELRGKGIGGSDAGIVMNVSLYRTNDAIEKGNALEPIMFNMFKVFYSKEYEVIDTKNISLSSKQFPFLRANLDGALIDKATGKKGILEIKSTTILNGAMFRYWNNDNVPLTYFFQCLHYMYVTGFDFAIVYAILDIPWENKQETRVIKMYREDLEADIEYLIKTELWFWDKVKTNTPPPFLENRNLELKEVN